jgi:phage terminase large subunit
MRKISIEITKKQGEAFRALKDDVCSEILFGGGAGGGKSYLGCIYTMVFSLQYEGVRTFIARESWENVRSTTQKTFFDVLARYELKKNVDYTYNGQTKTLIFKKTKSEVIFGYLKDEPSDPNFDYLGGREYSFVFVDETQEISVKAKNVMKTRIRYRLAENNIKPKMLMTCNPSKGWLYTNFYDPDRKGILPPEKKFIHSLATDNEHIDATYLENLRNNDDVAIKERLLYGNWDYDNDPRLMCEYQDINEMFKNNSLELEQGEYYLICDPARLGKDTSTISVWKGWRMVEAYEYRKQDTKVTRQKIQEIKAKYNIATHRILVDEVGVGGGIKDELGCEGFIANATAQLTDSGEKENYASLKDQCAYRLSKRVRDRQIAVTSIAGEIKERIIAEIAILKTDNKEDKPLKIISKEKQKEILRCSPDWLDNFIMRCYFKDDDNSGMLAIWL